MFWQKFDKAITVLLLTVAVAMAGVYIVRQNYTHEAQVHIPKEDKIKSIKVSVSGCVVNPGQYIMKKGSRVSDAIYAAGGVTSGADADAMDLAAVLTDGSEVLVPDQSGNCFHKGVKVLNINTASREELCNIPGIGETLADRIVEHRKAGGGFKDIAELKNVKGIGDKNFEKMKVYFVTEEP